MPTIIGSGRKLHAELSANRQARGRGRGSRDARIPAAPLSVLAAELGGDGARHGDYDAAKFADRAQR